MGTIISTQLQLGSGKEIQATQAPVIKPVVTLWLGNVFVGVGVRWWGTQVADSNSFDVSEMHGKWW